MKKIVVLLLIAIVSVSCGDDDGQNSNPIIEAEGFLEVGDARYDLKAGSLENLGSFEGSIFDFVLNLYSSNYTSLEPVIFDDAVVSGVSFDLYVNSPFDLVETDYEKVDFDDISGNTFQALDLLLDFDLENETGTSRQIVEGTLTVLSAKPIYELEFIGTDNEGEVVTFYYKGELEQLDSSGD